jgi:hypothetical protein
MPRHLFGVMSPAAFYGASSQAREYRLATVLPPIVPHCQVCGQLLALWLLLSHATKEANLLVRVCSGDWRRPARSLLLVGNFPIIQKELDSRYFSAKREFKMT